MSNVLDGVGKCMANLNLQNKKVSDAVARLDTVNAIVQVRDTTDSKKNVMHAIPVTLDKIDDDVFRIDINTIITLTLENKETYDEQKDTNLDFTGNLKIETDVPFVSRYDDA